MIRLNVSHVLPVTFTELQNLPVSCFLQSIVATVIGCTKSKNVTMPTPTTMMVVVLTAKLKMITFAWLLTNWLQVHLFASTTETFTWSSFTWKKMSPQTQCMFSSNWNHQPSISGLNRLSRCCSTLSPLSTLTLATYKPFLSTVWISSLPELKTSTKSNWSSIMMAVIWKALFSSSASNHLRQVSHPSLTSQLKTICISKSILRNLVFTCSVTLKKFTVPRVWYQKCHWLLDWWLWRWWFWDVVCLLVSWSFWSVWQWYNSVTFLWCSSRKYLQLSLVWRIWFLVTGTMMRVCLDKWIRMLCKMCTDWWGCKDQWYRMTT